MQTTSYHTPVLAEETLSFLINSTTGTYVDVTLGGGGHADAILRKLDHNGRLVGFDADDDALQFSSERLARFGQQATFRKGNFSDLKSNLSRCGVKEVDGVLFDLGVSSYQLDEPSKGFSFNSAGPLDMRMDRHQSLTGQDVVNEYDKDRLATIIWQFGEERYSRRIAKAIVEARMEKPITTGKDLAHVLAEVVGERFLTKTLARVFQAVRIEVNGELQNLTSGLAEAIDVLRPGGRLVVIAYHSLEDRIVKDTMKFASATSVAGVSKFLPPTALTARLKILTKKCVEPRESEIRSNPRARSAKLRAAEKL